MHFIDESPDYNKFHPFQTCENLIFVVPEWISFFDILTWEYPTFFPDSCLLVHG